MRSTTPAARYVTLITTRSAMPAVCSGQVYGVGAETGQAKTQAGQLLAEVNADAERRRAATHREVDDLTRQKDSIASHLAQVRQLLPGMNAVQAAQAKPAATGDPDK